MKGTVHFRRIKEGDAPLYRFVEKGDHLLPGANRGIAKGHPHTPQPHGRDFQIAVSKVTFLHFLSPVFDFIIE